MFRRAIDSLITRTDQQQVVEAIREAESRSSGEIKVHVETRCPGGDPVARAQALLRKFGLDKMRHRNGVILYVAVSDHFYAVVGDEGLDGPQWQALWEEVAQSLGERFKQRAYLSGLLGAVSRIGDRLAAEFPPERLAGDRRVSDQITGR